MALQAPLKKNLWLVLIFFVFTGNLWAQNQWDSILVMDNAVYHPNIKTVMLYNTTTAISNPIIALKGSNTITLKFDLLGNEVEDYGYTIVHCDKNWKPSGISPFDFIDGFTESSLSNYEFSFNTSVSFVHYSLEFPNSDMKPKLSGNYILVVFDENKAKKIVLSRRFCVVEPRVEILARIERSALPQFYITHQEIDFAINYKNFSISNAIQQIDVTLMQNFNWAVAKYNIKPTFIKEEVLEFISDTKFTFQGLKEYRFTDIRDFNLKHHSIKDIEQKPTKIILFSENIRTFKTYEYVRDANGKFVIGLRGIINPTNHFLEADYVDVKFSLQTNALFSSGNLYITGAFSDWKAKNEYKMIFNYETQTYEGTFLFKQGLYNYMYGFVKKGDDFVDCSKFEGSAYETENTYQILVYFRDFGERYDRLIAYEELNTLQSN